MPGITASAGWNLAKSSAFSSRTLPAWLVSGAVSLSFLFVDSSGHCNSLAKLLICMSTFYEASKANFHPGRKRPSL